MSPQDCFIWVIGGFLSLNVGDRCCTAISAAWCCALAPVAVAHGRKHDGASVRLGSNTQRATFNLETFVCSESGSLTQASLCFSLLMLGRGALVVT
jgi:hypothetical protein